MRFFLLLVTFLVATLPTYAFDDDDGGPPPPQVVRITGEDAACSGLAFVYQVEVANADNLTLNVTGGTISPVNAPLFNICGGIPNPSQPNPSRLVYTPNNGNCSFAISARIVWNASGTRRLTATVTGGGTTRTRTLTFTGNTPTITGPSGPLCVNDFGFTSFSFQSTGPPGASIQWSTSVFGGSSGLTISSPTSRNTNISGFQPSSFYNIRVAYTCPGQAPVTRTLNVQTLSLNDPQCGLNCPPGQLCIEPLAADNEPKDRQSEEIAPEDGLERGQVPAETATGRTTRASGVSFGEALTENNAVSVYPNPVRPAETLTVRLPWSTADSKESTFVRLIDFSGRVLYETEVNQPVLSVPMADVPPGGYLIQSIQGKEVSTAKLVVSPQRP